MRYRNEREYTKEEYKRNGIRTQNQHSKNQYITTLEEPPLNESGVIAKKKGF